MKFCIGQAGAARPRDWRGLALPAVFVVLWGCATTWQWVDTRLIPSPQDVLRTAWRALRQPDFLLGVLASLWRDLAGFACGASAGLALGTLMGVSRWAERIVGPTFHTLKQISLFAWLPLIASCLGSGDAAKILFIALSAFYPVALGSFEGVRSVSPAQFDVARVHAFTPRQRLTQLVLPAAAPQILTRVQLGLVYAWLATIGAEFLLAKQGVGLGDTVIRGRAAFDVALVIFGMGVIGAIGATFSRLAARLEARALRWQGRTP
ncbi:ABC transporter permease [Aquabacterium sp. A7-Y]|uniref:ABC transporter permease n=1 Tax=Aquabacterium sp. A7-Y TaxID=1349605 RepID=UPI00223E3EA1|nr:ABC transporter permease [Aquabacterium sp. A7-Y]MCW7540173.1 ABC transporter permease [Aquabacterium sp. A7-Y]